MLSRLFRARERHMTEADLKEMMDSIERHERLRHERNPKWFIFHDDHGTETAMPEYLARKMGYL